MLATMSERASASAVAQSATGAAGAPTSGAAGSASAPATARTEPLDQLIVDHGQQITRLVHRLLGWSPDIEDVVQDVFVDAFKSLSKFKSQSSVQTWLMRIAINRCRTYQRRQWLRRCFHKAATARCASSQEDVPFHAPLVPGERGAGSEGAASHLESAETHAQVHAAIQELNQRDRELVVLRYLEEQSIDMIAQTLNVKTNVVNVRLNRARARLEKILKPLFDNQ